MYIKKEIKMKNVQILFNMMYIGENIMKYRKNTLYK